MFDSLLLLALGLNDILELIKAVLAGGLELILAVLVVVLAIFSYWQLMANNRLEKDFRLKIEGLLREMLVRDKEAQEAIQAAVQVVHGFSSAMREQTASCEGARALSESTNRAVDDLRRAAETKNNLLDSLSIQIRDLREVTRSNRATGQ